MPSPGRASSPTRTLRFLAMGRFSSHGRAERLIAAGRVALATFSLLAVRVDPSNPARFANTASLLLSAYAGYALLLFAILCVVRTLPPWWPMVTHVFDLAAFVVLMYFTEGPLSPFFVYFIFSLACATLRWQWRGSLLTAVAAIVAYLAMGFYASRVSPGHGLELNAFILRSAHLIVVGVLLSYLGAHQERLNAERSRLAAWPKQESGEPRTVVRELLENAATVLEAPRMLMVWEEPEEAIFHVACLRDGEFVLSRESLEAFGSLVASPLAGENFLCADAGSDDARILTASGRLKEEWQGAPLDRQLQARFGIKAVLSWSLNGEALNGRLFALDKTGMTRDDLVLGDIVAGLAAARMDHFALRQRLRESAATEERIKLSRDLHDGLLQSLTGVALQLQVTRRMLERDPQAARERLRDIQAAIASEQNDLRSFVNRLKPAALAGSAGWNLRLRLEEVCNRIERQWGLRVKLSSQGLTNDLPVLVSDDVFRIVHEALVNAARHAEASSLQVEILRDGYSTLITVADDGHGFSFLGTYDLATLQRIKAGPITLKERISELGGDLVICSTTSGSRLDIQLPLPRGGG